MLALAILASLTAAVTPAVVAPSAGGRLLWPGPNSAVGEGTLSDRGVPVSFGSIALCGTGTSQPLRILSVAPIDPTGGLTVTAFATRPNPFLAKPPGGGMLGESRRPLSAEGFRPGGVQQVAACEPPRADTEGYPLAPTELAVTFVRPGDKRAEDKALRIHYADEHGNQHDYRLELRIVLCPRAVRHCTL